jgi:hypothetical protein
MKRIGMCVSVLVVLATAAGTARAERERGSLIVTASNQTANQLLVYDTAGTLVQATPTGGQGGVGGNAGGVAVLGRMIAVVNFGSSSVSIFDRRDDRFELDQVVAASSAPVSVAFGKDHLYVLGTTTVESHRIDSGTVDPTLDGLAGLVRADGSAAQVGVAGDELVISEKSNTVETVTLRGGAIDGTARAVTLPAGSNTPFGLATRGENAYVTIAHSDEVSLIKNDAVVAITATGTVGGAGQHSPCWAALLGPYLYTSNSPSHSVSRLIATGSNVTLDASVAATTPGAPTDIAAADKRVAVVDVSRGVSRVTQFIVDDNGNLTQVSQVAIAAPLNGIGIVVD